MNPYKLYTFGHNNAGKLCPFTVNDEDDLIVQPLDILTMLVDWLAGADPGLDLKKESNIKGEPVWTCFTGSVVRLETSTWTRYIHLGILPGHIPRRARSDPNDLKSVKKEVNDGIANEDDHGKYEDTSIQLLDTECTRVQFIGVDEILGYLDLNTGLVRSFQLPDPLDRTTHNDKLSGAHESSMKTQETRKWHNIIQLVDNKIYALPLPSSQNEVLQFPTLPSLSATPFTPLLALKLPPCASPSEPTISLIPGQSHLHISRQSPYTQELFGYGDNRSSAAHPDSSAPVISNLEMLEEFEGIRLNSVWGGLGTSGAVGEGGEGWVWGESSGVKRVRFSSLRKDKGSGNEDEEDDLSDSEEEEEEEIKCFKGNEGSLLLVTTENELYVKGKNQFAQLAIPPPPADLFPDFRAPPQYPHWIKHPTFRQTWGQGMDVHGVWIGSWGGWIWGQTDHEEVVEEQDKE